MGWDMVKRGQLALVLLLLISSVSARTFSGGATFKSGSYEDFFLRVVSESKTIHAPAGETTEFDLFVRRGEDDKAVHNFSIRSTNTEFTADFFPDRIEEIRNIDMVRVKCRVTVPDNTADSTIPMKIMISADEFIEDSYPLDTKIEVGGHSQVPGIIYLTLTFMLVGTLIWRKRTIFG